MRLSGETDDESDELYNFMQEQSLIHFRLYLLRQEEEPGMSDQVPDGVKIDALSDCLTLLDRFAATARHVGERCEVMTELKNLTGALGLSYTWFQAPDCDGAVHEERPQSEILSL